MRLLELIDRAEELLPIRVQLFRNKENRELHVSVFDRRTGLQVSDFRGLTQEAAEDYLRGQMGLAASLSTSPSES